MDLHPGEEIVFEGHPSWRSILGFYVLGELFVVAAAGIGYLVAEATGAIIGGVAVFALLTLVGFLKRIGTRYVITTERLHIRRGILSRKVQQTSIDRVQNVNTSQSAIQRMLQVGTVEFDTAANDDSDFIFAGVADPADVMASVDKARRAAAAKAPSSTAGV